MVELVAQLLQLHPRSLLLQQVMPAAVVLTSNSTVLTNRCSDA